MAKQIAVLIISALFGSFALAGEMYDFYSGVRQKGMGGAYTSVVNDETALLTNPAGLGKLRDVIVTIADPELEGSFTITDIITYENITAAFDSDELRQKLLAHPSKHWSSGFQVFPSIVGPNVGFGVLGKYSYDAELDSTSTVYRLDHVNDFAAVLGVNERFFGGIIKIGASARYVNRTEVHRDLDPNTEVDIDLIGSEGSGLAVDAGIILSAPIAALPSLSVVVRDAGQTSYELSDGLLHHTTSRPKPTKQRVDVGLGVFPILANQTRMTITADYFDVLGSDPDSGFMRRLHVGTEMNFQDFFFLRAGLNQGYWTAGIELASPQFQLQAACYGEEIGTSSDRREDRRWVGKFSIRF